MPMLFFGLLADHEEGALDVVLLQDVENLRRPVRIGSVVEAERDLLRVVAVLRRRCRRADRSPSTPAVIDAVLRRDGVVVVHGDDAPAVLRLAGDAQDVALALGVDVVAGLDLREVLHRVGRAGVVPDLPQGVVFRAEPPEREGLDAQRARGAHLVQNRDGVEEPDLMAHVRVLIVVGEVDVQRVVVEIDLRLGVRCRLPGLLRRERIALTAPFREAVFLAGFFRRRLRAAARSSSRSRSCRASR